RRVGPTRAANQRFGRRFDVRCTPTVNALRAFTGHVCGAFEDWVYTLFRVEEALTRPANIRLYGLMRKVRRPLKTRLPDILSGSYGYNREQTPADVPLLFSGCYFAATGNTPDRQAFVRGVFEKLTEEQEDVEWTPVAERADRRRRLVSSAGWIATGLLATAL